MSTLGHIPLYRIDIVSALSNPFLEITRVRLDGNRCLPVKPSGPDTNSFRRPKTTPLVPLFLFFPSFFL